MHHILSRLALCKTAWALHWYDTVLPEVVNCGTRLSSLRRGMCSLSTLNEEICFEKQVKDAGKNLIVITLFSFFKNFED